MVKDNSKDSDFFLLEWLYWLFDDVFGWDKYGRRVRYYYVDNGSVNDSGNGDSGDDVGDDGWNYDPGDDGWGYDPGDGDSGYDSGDGGWGYDPGNGGWGWDDTDTGPVQSIPAPGALVLGGIGLSFVSWLRRRRTL